MADEQIKKAVDNLIENNRCIMDDDGNDCDNCPLKNVYACNFAVVHHIQELLRQSKTQLKELLSALYQRTDGEQGFTLYRKDVVELAKDYGIKEEELK